MKSGTAELKLQPPGAGLPWLELLAARVGMRLLRLTTSRQNASRQFRQEGDRILALARSLPSSQAAEPVLIRRVFGIEDSSRHWSVLMVLEHLVIVNDAIAQVVRSLAAGKEVARQIGTADVKPQSEQQPEVIDRFAVCMTKYLEAIEIVPNLHTHLRYRHPWFGPLSGHGWHVLAAGHQAIHRRQIEQILKTGRHAD
jgi:hypothetical protein